MKFKDLPVDRYFRFATKDAIYQKLSAGRIRKFGEPGIIRYFKNEVIEDLGYDVFQFVSPIRIKIQKVKLAE